MSKFVSAVRDFFEDETGATAIEYGLMVGLIAAVIAVVITSLGTEIKAKFLAICNAVKGGTTACTS